MTEKTNKCILKINDIEIAVNDVRIGVVGGIEPTTSTIVGKTEYSGTFEITKIGLITPSKRQIRLYLRHLWFRLRYGKIYGGMFLGMPIFISENIGTVIILPPQAKELLKPSIKTRIMEIIRLK